MELKYDIYMLNNAQGTGESANTFVSCSMNL